MSQESGARLVVQRRSSASGSGEPVALPVSRQACLGLARAVLAASDSPGHWRLLCGGDAAVNAWLESAAGDCVDGRVERPAGSAVVPLVDRLAADLVVGMALHDQGRSPGAGEPAPEAVLLVEAVDRMRGHARLAMSFDRALESARLESARELAYGAGHEINNPLANIATRAQSLLIEERDPERRRWLATIVDQSFRARDMIGGLMLFARPPRPVAVTLGVGDLFANVVEAVRPAASARGVWLQAESPELSLEVVADRGQIEEALRAITLNAVEAGSAGGRVLLAARLQAGGTACEITVADDGSGMDEATVRRAFDPFFSGREAGRGVGLGLSKAWRFVEANGGSVVIASRPGEGTVVTVCLPVRIGGKVCPDSPA